ncbi:unnamed protein product, partial [marine sediment metagenome]
MRAGLISVEQVERLPESEEPLEEKEQDPHHPPLMAGISASALKASRR